MTPVAPRIVNDISYVTGIKHANHFARQAQYFGWSVTLVAPRNVSDVSCKTLQYAVVLCSAKVVFCR